MDDLSTTIDRNYIVCMYLFFIFSLFSNERMKFQHTRNYITANNEKKNSLKIQYITFNQSTQVFCYYYIQILQFIVTLERSIYIYIYCVLSKCDV